MAARNGVSPIKDRFPEQEVEQARRRTLYLAASLQRNGFLPEATTDVAPGASPALDYLSRYVRLVRLLVHGEQLFRRVLPAIMHHLGVSTGRTEELSPLSARGRLDVPTTYRHAARCGETYPSSFAVQRPERKYESFGNRLVALTLLMLQKQIDGVVHARGGGLTSFEKGKLSGLADQARTAMREKEFQDAAGRLTQEQRRDPDGPAARSLAEEVARRVGRTQEVPPNYQLLIEWRRYWPEYLSGLTGAMFKAPQVDVTEPRLYELLVLLEVATAFAHRARPRRAGQKRGRRQSGIATFEFKLEDGRQIDLWFQAEKTERLLPVVEELKGKPDIIIEIMEPRHRAVVIEAKSVWSPDGKLRGTHTQGVHDVMAYLFNYGYPRRWRSLQGGLVVFPHAGGERHPLAYRRLQKGRPAPLWIGSLIIPMTGADAACRAHLDHFVDDVITGRR